MNVNLALQNSHFKSYQIHFIKKMLTKSIEYSKKGTLGPVLNSPYYERFHEARKPDDVLWL